MKDMNMQETEYINVYGARVHNLKDIDAEIPRNSLTVITGLSGSGKSSLARPMPATSWGIWNVRMSIK